MRLLTGLSSPLLGALLALPVAPAVAGSGVAAPDRTSQVEIVSPERGSELRSEILDAVRPLFEEETGGPVEFVVTTLNVLDKWAYGDVKLQRPGAIPIDWRKTKFAADHTQGMLETEHNLFLMRNLGDGWAIMEYAIGPTDVAWEYWMEQHGLPRALFEGRPASF